jgi:hypothetical protein
MNVGLEEDWQQQSVRISESDQAKHLVGEKPFAEVPRVVPEMEEVLKEDDGVVRSKPWVIPLGWMLIVAYAGIIWLLYFSSVFRD